ncbi:hypothetical protein [Paramagnetospirillum magneticum]|uniref:Uncharacterized protein n=1 Tax=Paramagnetospirillum magneticum (strain ATCC 700264 / AMB-1) TaxID=342108 RepID=Q2VZX4_PARM1|nr:hypothetical protein [Paramagnetospirillum magneticum]BAE52851.1 hypothetical protein amb4047 [Paramagnetospirillum magneticum AMB-1]
MSQPKLYKPRSSKTHELKLFLTPAQHQRLTYVTSTYSDLMDRKVSQSVTFCRALDLLAGHLQAQLEAHPGEVIREAEKDALMRSMW